MFRSIASAEAIAKKSEKASIAREEARLAKLKKSLISGAMKINRPPVPGKFVKIANSGITAIENLAK